MHVSIIGAGPSGLGLALALHSHSISCTVYEQEPASGRFAGAMMLAPNALHILDSYGVYERICEYGYSFDHLEYRDGEGRKTSDTLPFGSKKLYGYSALRIYRNVLVKELQAAVRGKGIEVVYEKKFNEILKETETNVTFDFTDGTQVTSEILVAADGIHSKIRREIYPDVVAKYMGLLVVAGAVDLDKLIIPDGVKVDVPLTLAGKAGACVLAPQTPNCNEFLVGTQRPYPEQDRQGWERVANDLKFQHEFLEGGFPDPPPLVQSAVQNIKDESMYIWPLRMLPKLPSWTSQKGRVVIIGDAAHAIPPTTGQGANQALEDGFTLAMILAKSGHTSSDNTIVEFRTALDFWQEMRQERINHLSQLTVRLNNMRLPVAEQEKLSEDQLWRSDIEGPEGLSWLFDPKLEQKVADWYESQNN